MTSDLLANIYFAESHQNLPHSIAMKYKIAVFLCLILIVSTNGDGNRSYHSSGEAGTCGVRSGCTAPWQYCDNGTCKCGPAPYRELQCEVGKNLTTISAYCVTISVNQSSTVTEVGQCIFLNIYFYNLPNTEHELEEYLCVTGVAHCVVSVKTTTFP